MLYPEKQIFFFFLLLRTNLSLEADLALIHRLEEKPSSLTTRPWPFHRVQRFPHGAILRQAPVSHSSPPSLLLRGLGASRPCTEPFSRSAPPSSVSFFRPRLLGHPIPSGLPSTPHQFLFPSLFCCLLSICKMILLCVLVQCLSPFSRM